MSLEHTPGPGRAPLRQLARRRGALLLSLVLPAGALVGVGFGGVVRFPGDRWDFLVPGVVAMAVLSAALIDQAVATSRERSSGLVVGKVVANQWIEYGYRLLTVLVGLIVGLCVLTAWRARPRPDRPATRPHPAVSVLLGLQLGVPAVTG